ncbi:MAG: DEAD/DEAH box helicase [Dehalococcoidia bacterium]
MPARATTNPSRTRPAGAVQHNRPRRSVVRYESICAGCGAATKLPFKPTEDRPGYCSRCFTERKNLPFHVRQPGRTVTPVTARVQPQPVDEDPHLEVFPGLEVSTATRGALSRMGITSPTPIQEQAIPWLREGRDVVGQAQTGSGKTLAFGIPLVENCSRNEPGVQGLVLVPTRELAIQVASVLEAVADKRVLISLLYGGRPIGGEKRALQKGAQVIVGTPGRTLDHLRQGNLSLQSLRMLVLDEADEMLDRGFARDVESIIALTPADRQTALFSATLPEWVAKTSDKHLNDPMRVQVIADEADSLKIEHLIYRMEKDMKMRALRTLLDQRGDAPIIVFGRTKHGVKKLAMQLSGFGYPVTALQGNLGQNARERAMADFRSGTTPVLVATNVAARGLDVEGVAQVINFDLPDSLQLFTHRVGRTGRMGKSGEAVTFLTSEDDKKWQEIQRGFEVKLAIKRWGANGPEDAAAPPAAPSPRTKPADVRRSGRPTEAPRSRRGPAPAATASPRVGRFRR